MTTTPLLWKNEFRINQADSQTITIGPNTITLDDQINARTIELSNGNFLVAWESNTDVDSNNATFNAGSPSSWDVIGRIYDPLGNPVGNEFRLNRDRNSDSEGDFEIAATSGGFVIVYEDYENDSNSSNYQKTSLYMETFSNDGVVQDGVQFKEHTGITGGYYGGGGGLFNWFAGLFGSGSDPEMVYRNPNVTISGDIAMVTYEMAAGSEDHDVKAQFFDISDLTDFTKVEIGNFNGIPLFEMTIFNGAGSESGINNHDTIALSNGNFAIATSDQDASNDDDIIIRIVDTSGAQPALGTTVNIVNTNVLERDQVQIDALENGGMVVVYRIDGTGGTDSGLRFQVLANNGAVVTGPTNPHAGLNAGNQDLAAVTALKDGGFVIAWNDDQLNDMYLQRFDATGGTIGSRVLVANYNNFDVQNISLETLDDGRVIVSWSRDDGTNDHDVLSEIYDPRDTDTTGVNTKAGITIGTPGNDTNLDVDVGIEAAYGGEGNDDFIVDRLDGVQLIDGEGGQFNTVEFNRISGSALAGQFQGSDIDLISGTLSASVANLAGGTITVNTQLQNIQYVYGWDIAVAGDDIILNDDHLGADGRDGDDVITTLSFRDAASFKGGDGYDRLIVSMTGSGYDPATNHIFVDMADNDLYIVGTNGAERASLSGFEELSFFGGLDTDITGDADSNTIFGTTSSSAVDVIHGAGGNDFLFGRGGADILFGDEGEDELNGGGGADELYGGTEDDILNGGGGADLLVGNDGRDTLIGSSSGEDMFGNRDNDIFDPGAGQDDLDGGGGFDRVTYAGSSAGVTVNLDTGIGFGGDADGDTYIRLERVTGSEFDDTITGNDLGNSLKGNDGVDTIFGLEGRDVIEGKEGNDILYGGAQNDNVLGGADDDQLFGNSGFDKLYGGIGDDEMTGGADTDYFVFESGDGAFGQDVVFDFQDGVDRLDVRDVFSIANPSNVADDFSDFEVSVSAAYGVKVRFEAGQVIYLDDTATGITVADIDASDFIFA